MILRLAALSFFCIATAAGQESAEEIVDAAAAEERGFDYWLGRGVTADAAEAARWFGRAAAADRPVSLYMLGTLHLRGSGVPNDQSRAFELYRSAAERGIANAQAALGNAYLREDSVVGRDVAAARQWLEAAAAQDHSTALFLLGLMYRRGDGFQRDNERSHKLMLRAAELGHPAAAGVASTPLLYGPRESRDVARGLHLLERSATAGDTNGAYLLGWELMTGKHLPRDFGLAAQRYTQAIEGDLTFPALWLAELYSRGLGVEVDAARADELRAKAFARATPATRNSFAWDLATGDDPVLRNGAYAVVLMEALLADPTQRTPIYLDTLAAAYAEVARFDDAVRTQRLAIEALPADATPRMREAFVDRLTLYERREPYHEVL